MKFFEPAEDQPCYYCKRIHAQEEDHPIRDGIYTFENYVYRCLWHARFVCSRCGETHHFSWFYWCPNSKELICGSCNKPTLKPVAYWDKTYAYQFFCEDCKDYHYDLLYAEFQGTHPWQNDEEVNSALEGADKTQVWTPKSIRHGQDIPLEKALKLENRAILMRNERGLFSILQGPLPEKEVDLSITQQAWEKNSQIWIDASEEGDLNRQRILDPVLWDMLGDVRGLSVLDAGCGNGYLTRNLAKRGALAFGADISEVFIEYCKKKEEESKLGCRFIQALLTDLSQLKEKIFDLVVSNIVIGDVVDYRAAFREIARVLRDDGRFVWSDIHPALSHNGTVDIKFPYDSPRNEDRYAKMFDRYFDSGGYLIDWLDTPVWSFDRTLEELSRGLKEAGFFISEIHEPRPTLARIQQNPRHLAFDADRWTHFIIFDCAKHVSQ